MYCTGIQKKQFKPSRRFLSRLSRFLIVLAIITITWSAPRVYAEEISPDPNVGLGDVTSFNFDNQGAIDSDGGGGAASAQFQVFSTNYAKLTYEVTVPESFVGLYHAFLSAADLSHVDYFVMGIQAPADTRIKLEIKDDQNNVDSVTLIEQTGNEVFYKISKDFFDAINQASVKEINFIVTGADNPNQSGDFLIHFGDYSLGPDGQTGGEDVTPLPILQAGSIDSDGNGSAIEAALNILSNQKASLSYQVDHTGFAGIFQSFQGKPVDLTQISYLIFGLQSAQSPKVKLEMKDTSQARASLFLKGIDATERYYAIPNTLLAGVDLTHVEEINFLIEGSVNPDQAGALEFHLGFYPILPDPSLNQNDVTSFAFDATGVLDSDGNGNQVTATMEIASETQAALTYGLDTEGFAGIFHAFDNPQDFSGLDRMVMGLKAQSLTRLRWELKDSTNQASFIYLSGTNGSEQFYSLDPALFNAINLTQIKEVNLIIEGSQHPNQQGALDLRFGFYDFTPEVEPDPTKGPEDTTSLDFLNAGALDSDGNGNQITAEWEVTSETQGTLNFQVNETGFAGIFHSFDDPGTQPVEIADLTNIDPFILGIVIPQDMVVTFEVKDNQAHTNKAYLIEPTGTEQFYPITQDLFPDIDFTQILEMNLMIEGTLNPNAGGRLDLRLGFYLFDPEIEPDGNLGINDVTSLNNFGFAGFNGGGATQDFEVVSDTESRLTYNLVNQNGFVGVYHAYDDPDTPGFIETINLTHLEQLVMGISAPAGTVLKLEVKDIGNVVDFVFLVSQDGSEKFYGIDPALFESSDISQVKEINLVIDGDNPLNGILNLRFGFYESNFVVMPDPTKGLEDITLLDVQNFGTLDSDGQENGVTVVMDQPSSTQLDVTYHVGVENGFAGIFSTYAVPQDLSLLEDLIFGLGAPVDTIVRLELKDQSNVTQSVSFGGFDGIETKYYANFLEHFDQVNLTAITHINWVIFEAENDVIDGTLSLRFGVFPFQATELEPDPNKTGDDLTVLPDEPRVDRTGGSYEGNDVLQLSDTQTDLAYNEITEPGRFGGITIHYDDFSTPQEIETGDLSGLDEIVFGLSGLGTEKLKVEIRDGDDKQIIIPVGQISEDTQYYVIDTSRFNGLIDFSKIAFINFVVDSDLVTEEEGLLHLQIKGLFYDDLSLTPEQEQVRENLVAVQLAYFKPGVGLDPVTHLPYDNVDVDGVPAPMTQLTAIGFYLQILGEAAKGNLDLDLTREEVLTEVVMVLDQLLAYQNSIGWEDTGFLPAFIDLNTGEGGEFVSFADNSNLSLSIAVLTGAAESLTGLSQPEEQLVNDIATKGEAFLDAQGAGYQAFFDPTFNIFHLGYNTTTQGFEHYVDRLATEYRAGVAFVVTKYKDVLPQNATDAWFNLVPVYKTYVDQFTNDIPNLVPYDGGAFQNLWPLLWTQENRIVNISSAIRNFFYTNADYAYRYQIPGFISAAQLPEDTQYIGPLGIPEAAEKNYPPYADVFDIGSLYALASAYPLNPPIVINWLDAVTSQFPHFFSSAGIVDSFRSGSEYARRHIAVDQASFVLGLTGGGGRDLNAYLDNRSLLEDYKSLYDRLHLAISTTNQKAIEPPAVFPDVSLSVMNHFDSEGPIGNAEPRTTSIFGTSVFYEDEVSDFSGHFWKLSQDYDVRGNQFMFVYTSVVSPQSFRIELKDEFGSVFQSFDIQVPGNNELVRLKFELPSDQVFMHLREIAVVTEPNSTGIHSAEFFIHQIHFQFANECFRNPGICDDGNLCNGTETCDAFLGCLPGEPLQCDDGNLCNGTETCDEISGCEQGTPLVCDDNNVCNGTETCDEVLGCQTGTPLSCNDDNVCNGEETCDEVLGCQAGIPLVCDDNSLCTSDSCDSNNGCVFETIVCNDDNLCNGTESCDPFVGCVAGNPLVCDDQNVCNGIEICDAIQGCITGTPLVCNDNNLCNGTESCDAVLGCEAGTPLNCQDGDICTNDVCDPNAGCVFSAVDCNDDNACTLDACFPQIGCQNAVVDNGSACTDSNVCNGTELCQDGICEPGTPLNCDDGTACSVDSCDSALGCQHDFSNCITPPNDSPTDADDGTPTDTPTFIGGGGFSGTIAVANQNNPNSQLTDLLETISSQINSMEPPQRKTPGIFYDRNGGVSPDGRYTEAQYQNVLNDSAQDGFFPVSTEPNRLPTDALPQLPVQTASETVAGHDYAEMPVAAPQESESTLRSPVKKEVNVLAMLKNQLKLLYEWLLKLLYT